MDRKCSFSFFPTKIQTQNFDWLFYYVKMKKKNKLHWVNKTVHKRLRTNGNYMHLMRNKMIGLCQYEKFIVPMWLFQHLSELNKSKQSELHAIHAHAVHRLPRDSFYVTIPRYKVHFFHFNGSPKNTYIENLPFFIEQCFMDTNYNGERERHRQSKGQS